MKVSIVTPSYNQKRFLAETIESVLAQDYPDIEYVLVDDASSDGSLEVARRYEDRLHALLVQPENGGQVAAINRGFAETNGELMAYINSDDTLLPGAVSEMVAQFREHPDLVMVYGDSVYIDAESNKTGVLEARPWDPPTMVRNCDNHVPQPSSMWTRASWNTAGPFDPRGYYFFDFELYLRLSVLGPVQRVQRQWSTYREHPDSKTIGDQLGKARDYLRFADTFLTSDRLPAELRQYARRGRSSARIAAATNMYGELELGLARRWAWKGLLLDPTNISRRSASLALKTLLPRPVVARLRRKRHGTHRD